MIDEGGVLYKHFPGDDTHTFQDACKYARQASVTHKGKQFHVVKTKQVIYTEQPPEEAQKEEKRIITRI